jgi:hypothetical protein
LKETPRPNFLFSPLDQPQPHQFTQFHQFRKFTYSPPPSSRAQTDCSSSLIVSVPMKLKNGDLHGLPSATPSPYIFHARWMVGSYSNSTYVTQQIDIITRSTNVIGSNFTDARTFTIPRYPARCTLFAHLIRPTTLHSARIFFLLGNGSI